MTREEAINYGYECLMNESLFPSDREFVEIAIQVLEQESAIDKIRAEIEQIEINGHIRDVECFTAGINTALKIIGKYRVERSEE